jgi:NAD(P)-dependent dehydrogenase (short-subunit alcohol dehydrogenase family)
MKSSFRSKHADMVVLVRSDVFGLATGRRLAAEGATVYAVEPIGELRRVGAFAKCELAEREEAVLVHWRQEMITHSADLTQYQAETRARSQSCLSDWFRH